MKNKGKVPLLYIQLCKAKEIILLLEIIHVSNYLIIFLIYLTLHICKNRNGLDRDE